MHLAFLRTGPSGTIVHESAGGELRKAGGQKLLAGREGLCRLLCCCGRFAQHLLPERSLSRKAGLHPRRDPHPAVGHSVGPPLTLALDLVELTKVFKGSC